MTQHSRFSPKTGFGRTFCVQPSLAAALAVLAVALSGPLGAQTPAPPAAVYGPFNAVFLADGPGLSKPMSPAASLDGLAAVATTIQGSNQQPVMQDPILAGRASWTLAFWFESLGAAARDGVAGRHRRSSRGGCALHRYPGQSAGALAGAGARFGRVRRRRQCA